MNADLTQLAHDLESARDPQTLFGNSHLPHAEQAGAARKAYHRLARIAHPDAYRQADEQELARRTFQALAAWYARAEAQIAAGTYGRPASAPVRVTLKTRVREYLVDTAYLVDGIYNAYPCQYRSHGRRQAATLKIVREACDNDLARNELRALGHLRRRRTDRAFFPYLPRPLESFLYEQGGRTRQALILEAEPGWFSLEEVRTAYPAGIDPKDMAWIWRRLLVILGYAHLSGVLHRAVLPPNIWIQPELHGLQLRNWTHASMSWHHPGHARGAASTRADIARAARTMIYLLGGDTENDSLPHTVPHPIKAFLRGSTLAGLGAPENAWELKAEFDELLASLWGERVFHPFSMPNPNKPEEVHNG
jgi:hypothetical protein